MHTLLIEPLLSLPIEFTDFIFDEKPGFVLVTETWINDNNCFVCPQITPTGYSLCQMPRPQKRGGGTAILCNLSYLPTS